MLYSYYSLPKNTNIYVNIINNVQKIIGGQGISPYKFFPVKTRLEMSLNHAEKRVEEDL